MTTVVETDRPYVAIEQRPDTWPLATSDYTLYDYLQFGGPVVDVCQDVAGYCPDRGA